MNMKIIINLSEITFGRIYSANANQTTISVTLGIVCTTYPAYSNSAQNIKYICSLCEGSTLPISLKVSI